MSCYRSLPSPPSTARIDRTRLTAMGRVRTAVTEVERARTEVRLVHLLTHLRTRAMLSDEQRRLYHEARWGK